MAPIRSALFVPGNREALFEKAIRLAPSAIILDLEDSVPEKLSVGPQEQETGTRTESADDPKEVARQMISTFTEKESVGVTTLVRVRSALTPHLLGDIESAVGPGLSAILLPQADAPEYVDVAATALARCENAHGLEPGSIGIFVMPESAKGVMNSFATMTASSRVQGVIFAGAEVGDLVADLRFRPPLQGEELLYAKSKIQLGARAAGLPHILDGAFAALEDSDAFLRDSRQGWRMGFTGRVAVHPSQVALLNELYAPSESEIRQALEILDALDRGAESGQGAIAYKGQMLDIASRRAAEAILLEAGLSRGK